MPFDEIYRRQVALLIRVLPLTAEENVFALKGGTAINLFLRNMPRLSVDIDLAYLPVAPRQQSLTGIDTAMRRIAARIRTAVPGSQVDESPLHREGVVTKLIVRSSRAQIKVEVTPVLRGCVHSPSMRAVSPVVEDAFGYAECQVVSFADLYGGKIVAALDRQHPRDLFDIVELFANEGIDDALRSAFIVYLLSHGRPMHEVLEPRPKDIRREFARGFQGMTTEQVELEKLIKEREHLIATIVGDMPDAHRRFLISFKRGVPDWSLLDLEGVADLPAIKWRQLNLNKLNQKVRANLVAKLEKILVP